MKTKSKRFLNLATLCLALLGTTLLTTQPVKAEVVMTQSPAGGSNSSERNSEQQDQDQDKVQQRGDSKEDWDRGYDDGYKKGEESDTREKLDRSTFGSFPPGISDQGEYLDGYEGGYEAGWRKGHPVEAFLEMAWHFLTYAFTSLFGGGGSPQ
ncbi:TPA: hypothetical protein VIN91_000997 [Streptococcus pyogenes]|uniref:hypothetical protein n=1 Tax=Streptococcus pyogenes TaxID=1314 RepID=UPI0007C0D401|nr:hypothetical protein [Streptococcus pyogenes]ANC75281.1 hypothetical protein A4265_01795 [Streptococcus pyogenes]SUO52171.1 hypothetical membrane associated protein [Streptococcus pyogenes]SUO57154.1 hypothetical membrane associated protein [Streptococcus pyogenes]VGT41341.1 hypothetical membrane associated protein [Streptococcus pyogenes]VGW67465.1 Uncharacterised protein [Streptococcus pyogenes]